MIPCKEFQAVVLAGGKGSRMTELTSGQSKCLLPIGNVPMIWHPLKLLERAGFKEAIVVVPQETESSFVQALDKLELKIKLDIVGVEDAEDLGTADSLRLVHEKIHMDFVAISCDLITDVTLDITDVLDQYRKHNASITALMLPVPNLPDDYITPGVKSKPKPETDLIGIDDETGRIVFLASASDFEETINISQRLLRKHTSFTVHSKLMDAHLYVINKWILDFLVHNKNFSTLKGELLPYVVSKQLSKPKKYVEDKNTSIVQEDLKEDIFRFAANEPLDELIRKMSGFNDHSTDLEDAYHDDIIRCYAYILKDKFGLRANTIQMYHYANLKASSLQGEEMNHGRRYTRQNHFASGSIVGSSDIQDCRIDSGAIVSAHSYFRHCHIESGSIVEGQCRIIDTIIMKGSIVKPGCYLTHCIIGSGAIVQPNTRLTNCVVASGAIVGPGNTYNCETLTNAGRLIEI